MIKNNIEIQDDKGNIFYPHTSSKVVFLENGKNIDEVVIENNNDKMQINKKIEDSIKLNEVKLNELSSNISNNIETLSTNIESKINKLDQKVLKEINKIKSTIVYMSDIEETNDYSIPLNKLIGKTQDYVIICENNKEYNFRTPVKILGRIIIEGNDSLWRYHGSGTFIQFVESPWNIEGSRIENLICWSGEKVEGAYSSRTLFEIQGNHINIKFRNIKSYNFGYAWKMKDTNINGSVKHCFGHSITECSVWGFINAILSSGNAEQIEVFHCWFDDGKRTNNSQNACIKVTDATSFWIRDNVIQNCDIGIAFNGVRNGEIQGNHFENMIDSSIFFLPNSAYENRGTNIIGNWLVGHKGCIRFLKSGNLKSIHTTIIGNTFAFLGEAVQTYMTSTSEAQSNTQLLNNSRIDGSKQYYSSTIVTLKEWQ